MPLAFRSYHTLPRTSHWIPRRVGWDVGAGVGLAEGGRVVGAVATAAAAPASYSRDCDECCTPALVLPPPPPPAAFCSCDVDWCCTPRLPWRRRGSATSAGEAMALVPSFSGLMVWIVSCGE